MGKSVLKVKEAIYDLDIDNIKDIVKERLDQGIEPWSIIKDGMGEGMAVVGDRFEKGEYYLADLILAGEVMKEGMEILEDKIDKAESGSKGTVILATVKGDIHDIGKNIVGVMLSASDFEVIDLGVDVPEDKIVKAVKDTGAPAIGLSVLLTTMIGAIKDVVDALKEAGLRDKVKIMVGGGTLDEKVGEYVGADSFGRFAGDAVSMAQKWTGGK